VSTGGPRVLVDRYGRVHDYLRISVTDRCNLRCDYCMGPAGVPLLEPGQILSYEEIVTVVECAARLGIRKVRISGGEPLVRKRAAGLIKRLAAIPGIADLALTTNGQLLSAQAEELGKAGLNRVNISLDSLKPAIYRQVTRGGDLAEALAGIAAAIKVGLKPVKLNVVLMKGINDTEIPAFLEFASQRQLHLRFIEYMPVSPYTKDWQERYLPLEAVLAELRSLGYTVESLTNPGDCRGPAEIYQVQGMNGTLGLIRPVSRHFCARCNRLRLTADGYLKPCLYWAEELSVRPVLDQPAALQDLFFKALEIKRIKHEMQQEHPVHHNRGMSAIGG